MHVIHEPTDLSFEKVGIKGKLFPSRQLSDKVSFVLVETETGHETTILQQESLFAYYVLEGSGYFEIDDVKEVCAKGDLVVIPEGKKFTYKGNLKLFLACAPPWREEQEETIG